MRALVFANGELNDGPAVRAALEGAETSLVVAVDGGARLAQAYGLAPDLVIGDMDSLSPDELDALAAAGAHIERAPAEKNETDLELALLAATAQDAHPIILIGGAGGRIDQMLANLYLLTMPELRGRSVRLVAGTQTVWVAWPGEHALQGAAGDTISLIPLTPEAVAVRTENLYYPLRDETLYMGAARGVSNVMRGAEGGFRFREGLLLVVHTIGHA